MLREGCKELWEGYFRHYEIWQVQRAWAEKSLEGSMGNHWNLEAIFGFYSECIMGSLENVDQRVTIKFTFLKDPSSYYYEDSVL